MSWRAAAASSSRLVLNAAMSGVIVDATLLHPEFVAEELVQLVRLERQALHLDREVAGADRIEELLATIA